MEFRNHGGRLSIFMSQKNEKKKLYIFILRDFEAGNKQQLYEHLTSHVPCNLKSSRLCNLFFKYFN
jgi:hypothetical protein